MKTPEEWSGLILGLHYKSSAIPIIEQIQRDAREGTIDRKLAQETLEEAMETMVPVEDVRPVVVALMNLEKVENVMITPTTVEFAKFVLLQCHSELRTLRAKHPNLFPK